MRCSVCDELIPEGSLFCPNCGAHREPFPLMHQQARYAIDRSPQQSWIFGTEVRPEHVIGETLRRATENRDVEHDAFVRDLTRRVADSDLQPPDRYHEFVEDPISRFRLRSPDFAAYGARLAKLRLPTLFVMEGGYAVEAIGINTVNVLIGFEGAS